jgi:uncharacterized protein YjbI with pentapeptide repeats
MAVGEHVERLLRAAKAQSPALWNEWRRQQPPELEIDLGGTELSGPGNSFVPPGIESDERLSGFPNLRLYLADFDLSSVNLNNTYMNGAILDRADCRGTWFGGSDLSSSLIRNANFSGAFLAGASLSGSDLTGTDFTGAILSRSQMIEVNLQDASLQGAQVYGVSCWATRGTPVDQRDLVMTAPYAGVPTITVDDIRVAQFVHLLLENPQVRNVIDTIGRKGVLILGRFSQERKLVLNQLREALRERNFVPFVLDFEKPASRDFSETLLTLAGMSLFVIVDVTNPRSAPLELQATVPNYMVPFVPIIQEGEPAFSMLRDLQGKFDWVLPELIYDTPANLIRVIDHAVIEPALRMANNLNDRRMRQVSPTHIRNL